MKKFVFWNILNKHLNVALTEDLSKYATGATFWQAMMNLAETLQEWIPSGSTEETEINHRLKMYNETGINKVELIVSQEGDRYAVKCANSRSFFEAGSEEVALEKFISTRAKTSIVNKGEVLNP